SRGGLGCGAARSVGAPPGGPRAGGARPAAVGKRPDVFRGRHARRHLGSLPAFLQVTPVRLRCSLRPGAAVAVGPVLRLYAELAVGPRGRIESVPRYQLPAIVLLEVGAHRRRAAPGNPRLATRRAHSAEARA